MGHTKYTAVPVEDRPSAGWARGAEEDDGGDDRRRPRSWYERARQALFTSSLVTMTLILGFCLGREHEHRGIGGVGSGMSTGGANGLLSPQAFVPEGTCSRGSLTLSRRGRRIGPSHVVLGAPAHPRARYRTGAGQSTGYFPVDEDATGWCVLGRDGVEQTDHDFITPGDKWGVPGIREAGPCDVVHRG